MSNEIIDMHVHFASPWDQNGNKQECYWTESFTNTVAYFALRIVTGMAFSEMSYETVKARLFKEIKKAKRIDKVVLLALDKVYDSQGIPLHEDTMVYISNKCLADLKEDYKNQYNKDKILVGCSVHPFNPNWEEELDKCITQYGAVLCKWMPSSQQINPESYRFDDFYKKLAKHNLPLLYHTGPEHSIPCSNKDYNKYNNPKFMVDALKAGVTVIAAHCALPYFGPFESTKDFEDLCELFKQRDEKDWKLYADLSALCTGLRNPFIEDVKSKIKPEYLIYGSDFPIPTSEFSYNAGRDLISKLKIFFMAISMKNLINKSHYLIGKMGFNKKYPDGSIFTNFAKLSDQIVR